MRLEGMIEMKPKCARIDAAEMQMPEVLQDARRQRYVKRSHIDGRERISTFERRRPQCELPHSVITRLEPVVRRVAQPGQHSVRLWRRSSAHVYPYRAVPRRGVELAEVVVVVGVALTGATGECHQQNACNDDHSA